VRLHGGFSVGAPQLGAAGEARRVEAQEVPREVWENVGKPWENVGKCGKNQGKMDQNGSKWMV